MVTVPGWWRRRGVDGGDAYTESERRGGEQRRGAAPRTLLRAPTHTHTRTHTLTLATGDTSNVWPCL